MSLNIQELDHLKIPLEDIISATGNFSNDNKIGQGGFGKVYKGQFPLSTTTVAVKRLDINHGQGLKEFLNEITMLCRYKHDNLSTLTGFCEEGDEKIIVYKYEFRGSLDKYLVSTDLTWVQRLRICLGAARGLDYLHNGVSKGHRVVHRDIKSSNILLDENWEAKVSDFGLSRIGLTKQEFSFVVTNASGTHGYVDPQYETTGMLTKESDVFSFGVVLFEVLCGRLAMVGKYQDERRFLHSLAKLRYNKGKLDEIVFPNLRKQMKSGSLQIFARIAIQCLNEDRKTRPTMGLIMEELQNALEFQMGVRKMAQFGFWGSNTGGSPWSLQLDNNKKLRSITIDHKDWIYSIAFTIEHFDGSLHSSQEYGGTGGRSGGSISQINFDADEEIIQILGTVGVSTGKYWGYTVISSLCFVTKKGRYGPLGKETGTPFSIPWNVGSFGGFYGRGGFYMDGIGFYLKDIV